MSWRHDIRWGPCYCWQEPLTSRGALLTFNPLQQTRHPTDVPADITPVEQTTTTDPHGITDEA